MALAQIYTASAGDVITAARWNNEFGNIYSNGTDVAFPATKAVSFAGQSVTFDSAGFSLINSTSSCAFLFTTGAKSGTPSANGSYGAFASSTFTDTNTAGSGTAALYTALSVRTPTLAANNSSVTTTNAATVYIEAAPVAGTHETITNAWAFFVAAGASKFVGAITASSDVTIAGTLRLDGATSGIGIPAINELRLSLTTALPVTTADVTAAGTLYLVPYKGSHISLYDGSVWKTFSTAQISLGLTLTSGKPYDVFCYISSGAPALEVLVWTNDTTRATVLAYQNGVLVKSGDATRRYLGSLYASGTNQTEDSLAKRYLWNYYHRVLRPMKPATETTDTWTYTTATWQQANANTANQLDCIIGVAEDAVTADVSSMSRNSSANIARSVGIGLNSTTVDSSQTRMNFSTVSAANAIIVATAAYRGLLAEGRTKIAWLERSVATGTATWLGDNGDTTYQQSGIVGTVMA